MRFSLLRTLPALVVGALIGSACGAEDLVVPPNDAGALPDATTDDGGAPLNDAASDSHPSPDDGSVVPEDAALDADSQDAAPDADSQDAAPDADSQDAALDADSQDASADAGDAGDAGPPPPPLFAPGESGAAYTITSVCRIATTRRVGAVDMCCIWNDFTTTTTCDTIMREEPDGAGSLKVVIDPLQSCARTPSAELCNRSGNLPRCDSNNMVCPIRPFAAGERFGAGTYARRMRIASPGGERVPVDHYWVPGCPVGPAGYTYQAQSRCSPSGGAYSSSRDILTTLARTGPGAFVLRRTWDQSIHRSCTDERYPVIPLALPNSFVTSGSGAGGTFRYDRYDCTYTLTKK